LGVFFGFLAVLGLELGAYTLSHSTSSFFVMVFFEIGSWELIAWVRTTILLNLCLLSSYDYRREPLVPSWRPCFKEEH
jgi:hypothetical protein